jgi:hypothetical protein
VRPILEYNTTVWSPCAIQLIDLLESVQRNFSKRIPSLSTCPYAERLAILNLDTLELRRLRFDIIFYYKVLNHLTPFNPHSVFTIYTPPSCLRTNLPFLRRPGNSSSKILSTTFYGSIPAWNSLPINLRLSASLLSFKRNLKAADLAMFLKGAANTQ